MKRIIFLILAIIVAIAGIVGTIYFYTQNKNQIAQNTQLVAQNSAIQSQLNAIGTMGTAYEVATRVYSGKEIKDTDLIEVSIPMSAMGESSIQDRSQLVGKAYKVDIKPGTILTSDLLMDVQEDLFVRKYTRELRFNALPLGTLEGDYIDIRMLLPNGEEYVVFSHLKVDKIASDGCTISFKVSEEENYIFLSMLQDAANYASTTCFYALRYLEPGRDTDTVAAYPVQHEMTKWIMYNPNIVDSTRCINESMRDHIDEILLKFSTGENAAVASSFISAVSTQVVASGDMRNEWLEQSTDEEGNVNVEDYGNEEGGSFQEDVNDAMDGLEEDLGELGEMVDEEAIN